MTLEPSAVKAGEFGAGHTGSDDDEVLWRLFERIQLRPGEDTFAVGHRRGEDARTRADRHDDGVRIDLVEVRAGSALTGRHDDAVGSVQSAVALDHGYPGLDQLRLHVFGLLAGQAHQSLVDGREVDGDLRAYRSPGITAKEKLHSEVGGLADGVRCLGCGDEGFGRHHVGEHRRAANPDTLDDGDLGSHLRSGERRFVAPGAAPDDSDTLLALKFIGHTSILPQGKVFSRREQ